jgi:hypothetical protein
MRRMRGPIGLSQQLNAVERGEAKYNSLESRLITGRTNPTSCDTPGGKRTFRDPVRLLRPAKVKTSGRYQGIGHGIARIRGRHGSPPLPFKALARAGCARNPLEHNRISKPGELIVQGEWAPTSGMAGRIR